MVSVQIQLIGNYCQPPTPEEQTAYHHSLEVDHAQRIFNFQKFTDRISQSGQLDHPYLKESNQKIYKNDK